MWKCDLIYFLLVYCSSWSLQVFIFHAVQESVFRNFRLENARKEKLIKKAQLKGLVRKKSKILFAVVSNFLSHSLSLSLSLSFALSLFFLDRYAVIHSDPKTALLFT